MDALVGQTFGQLTIKERLFTKRGSRRFLCECSCGKGIVLAHSDIRTLERPRGRVSCGCTFEEAYKNGWRRRRINSKIGQRFGKLVVLRMLENNDIHARQYLCKCDCGNEVATTAQRLTGKKESCGCDVNRKGKFNPMYKGHEEISGSFITRLKRNARNRGYEYDLTPKYLWELFVSQGGRCAFSGRLLTLELRDGFTASLDRIENSRGYVVGNVQWTDKYLNVMKGSHTDADFVAMCHEVSDHQRSKTNIVSIRAPGWGSAA